MSWLNVRPASPAEIEEARKAAAELSGKKNHTPGYGSEWRAAGESPSRDEIETPVKADLTPSLKPA